MTPIFRRVYDLFESAGGYARFEQAESLNPDLILRDIDWEEMGRPLKITLTIEAGDTLNV